MSNLKFAFKTFLTVELEILMSKMKILRDLWQLKYKNVGQ